MNEMKPEDVMRALELQVQRHLMPNVDVDGTVSVENAERWFLKLLKEKLAPYMSALLRDKDAEIERLREIIVKGDYSSYTARLATETWHRNNLEFIRRLEAEIERLSHHCDDCAGCTQWKCDGSNIRAEVITDFLDRAIDKGVCKDYGDGTERLYVSCEDLREIARELKGEGNGNCE